jgi:hypothetical protein
LFGGLRLTRPGTGWRNATIGVPVGYQFHGGDGRTRQFIRIVPSYDRARDSLFIAALFEWNLH